ncbi:MAG: Clp protease N-terminal domain-containing protein [Chloroflexi bacterium]|nr:Clp protease N-terminal domain-containing protein [Chloroflexota bacterium]
MERLTQRARRVLSLAHQEAERMRHNYIGTEHLLLGLIREEGGVAARVLRELGLEASRVEEIVQRLTGTGTAVGSVGTAAVSGLPSAPRLPKSGASVRSTTGLGSAVTRCFRFPICMVPPL